MDIIYGCVKCAKAPDTDKFRAVAHELCDAGCDAIVLGCTELSLLDAAKYVRNADLWTRFLFLLKSPLKTAAHFPSDLMKYTTKGG